MNNCKITVGKVLVTTKTVVSGVFWGHCTMLGVTRNVLPLLFKQRK